jgi:hypothetical protein
MAIDIVGGASFLHYTSLVSEQCGRYMLLATLLTLLISR